MLAHHPISIDGKQYQLEILSATVLDYKERSETHVYGGSDGRGNVGVGSRVSLYVDIWLEEYQTNAELHGTYSKSLGMRPGNIFHQITLIGLCKEPLVIAIYNSSTREFVELWQNQSAWDMAFKKSLLTRPGGVGLAITLLVILTLILLIPLIIVSSLIEKEENKKKAHFEESLRMLLKQIVPNLVKDIHADLVFKETKKSLDTQQSFCSKCGSKSAPDSKFCAECGALIAGVS